MKAVFVKPDNKFLFKEIPEIIPYYYFAVLPKLNFCVSSEDAEPQFPQIRKEEYRFDHFGEIESSIEKIAVYMYQKTTN